MLDAEAMIQVLKATQAVGDAVISACSRTYRVDARHLQVLFHQG